MVKLVMTQTLHFIFSLHFQRLINEWLPLSAEQPLLHKPQTFIVQYKRQGTASRQTLDLTVQVSSLLFSIFQQESYFKISQSHLKSCHMKPINASFPSTINL